MKITYNEILNAMKTAFFNECGETVQPLSDLGARFKAVASELFSVSCYGDYILKQSYPQTATGEYLDFHAQLRGIKRKTASKAVGTLTFSIPEAVETDTQIGAGTLCAVRDAPYIQFSTTERVTIPAGETAVNTPAEAIAFGEDYNVKSGAVTVMVNPPIGVNAVVNEFDFCGGYSGESDSELRKRIIRAYSVPSKGLSIEMLRTAVLENDDIIDCSIVKNNSGVNVYVVTRQYSINDEIIGSVVNSLQILKFFGMDIEVYPAKQKPFALNIELCSNNNVDREIISAVNEFARSIKVGENVKLNQLISIIASIDGVEYCSVGSNTADGGIIPCGSNELLRLSDTEVQYVE